MSASAVIDFVIEPIGKRVCAVTGSLASTFAYPSVSVCSVPVASVTTTDIPGAPCSSSARGA